MIHVLDTQQLGQRGIVAATALETPGGVALFDTGPESTFRNVAQELARIGATPEDVRHVFLSHIHFDHAGAAWRFAESGATIYVHPRGAPHLIDPAKLVESATRIFGADMPRLWGEVRPIAAGNVRVVNEGDTITVGEKRIRALETPGHASHHHVYHWDDHLFGGDVAGVRIGHGPPIPPFVPPELHVGQWCESIAKMRALKTEHLYLPHFGKVAGPIDEHLNALEETVRRWAAWLENRIRGGSGEEQLRGDFSAFEAAELRAGGATEADVAGYEGADPSYMAVLAALRSWKKFGAVI